MIILFSSEKIEQFPFEISTKMTSAKQGV